LKVTHQFGSSVVFARSVGFAADQTLMDVMREHLEVETAYGGGFVNEIAGTKSAYTGKSIFTRKKRDWFYYVNGSVGAVAADSYRLHGGDSVWWDYHDWSGEGSNAPCVVGSYPHPFTTGYDGAIHGTVIYYSGDHAADAERLADGLRSLGAERVSTAAYDDGGVLQAASNVIVLGTWAELGDKAAMQQLMENPTRTGLYARFEDGAFSMLTYQGKPTGRSGQAAILATGDGNGDTSPIWLVLGATEEGLDQAIDVMVGSPQQLQNKLGVVLEGGTAVGVPVSP
jgi:hypothetical protein